MKDGPTAIVMLTILFVLGLIAGLLINIVETLQRIEALL